MIRCYHLPHQTLTQREVLYDAKRHAHTAQGLPLSSVHGDLLWCDGGWPGSCHEQELVQLSGLGGVLGAAGVTPLFARGFRGMARAPLAGAAVPHPGGVPGRWGIWCAWAAGYTASAHERASRAAS